MSQSHRDEIENFRLLSGWTTEDKIIDFLQLFNWQLDLAVDFFLNFLNESISQQQTSETGSGLSTLTDNKEYDPEKRVKYIDENIIGNNVIIETPWGYRKSFYADYTASGRALSFVEDNIRNDVLPYYANTHSENTLFALKTTKYREESRLLIKKCVNATDDDVLIFTGAGSTAAINQLVGVLDLKNENVRNKTVVFVSTFEHHSNILPWSETGVEFVRIPNTNEGLLDVNILTRQLKYYYNTVKKQIICTFNAASNVTGILTETDSVSELVHQYEGYIFWDYAAGAPYLKIDMNPSKRASKDAIFISTHKFVGGPSTPGILIAKKHLFRNKVPVYPGGGTVNFVVRDQSEYTKDIETREEGGTPDIIGSIKAGLVFQLKNSVGEQFIKKREEELVKKYFQRFRSHSRLMTLGSSNLARIGIFSFLIYVPEFKKYLHHHFICVLLNDLFGIQVRSGCSCAGPYVLELLGIDDEKAKIYTKFITEDDENTVSSIPKIVLMKPGFTRFNLSYFISNEEVDYILHSIEFIANNGWQFLSLYTYDPTKATWRPRRFPTVNNSMNNVNFQSSTENMTTQEEYNPESPKLLKNMINILNLSSSLSADPFDQAEIMKKNLSGYIHDHFNCQPDPPLNIPTQYRDYTWFVTPKEVIRKMIQMMDESPQPPTPFHPN